MLSEGTTLYHSDDSEQSIKEAREYCKNNGYGKEDVKIIKKDGFVMVITRREIHD